MMAAQTSSAVCAPRWTAAGPTSSTPTGPKSIDPKASYDATRDRACGGT